MTGENTSALAAMDDSALVAMVRRGRLHGYSTLFRRHYPSAVNYARQFVGGIEAQDVAQEAFLRVLRAMREGGGPREEFVAYLLRTVRNLCTDIVRRRREVPVDDVESTLANLPSSDDVEAGLDRGLVTTAFRALPEKWQEVLWLTEVEGHAPRTLAAHYQISAGAVAQLSRRAREGLRSAWLQAHISSAAPEPRCVPTRSVLGEFERGLLSPGRVGRVEEHLRTCAPCAAALAELRTVSRRTRVALLPVFLGSGPLLAQGAAWSGAAGGRSGSGPAMAGGAAAGTGIVVATGRLAGGQGAAEAGAGGQGGGGVGASDAAGVPALANGAGAADAGASTAWWLGLHRHRMWWAGLVVAVSLVVIVVLLVLARQTSQERPLAGVLGSPGVQAASEDITTAPTPTAEEESGAEPDQAGSSIDRADAAPLGMAASRELNASDSSGPIPLAPEPVRDQATDEGSAAPAEPVPPEETETPVTPGEPPAPTEPQPTEPEPTEPEPTEPEPTEPPPAAPTLAGPVGGEQRQPVTLSGTAEPGATVRVLDPSGAEVATATAAEDGTWSAVPPVGAVDVATTYRATQVLDGAESAPSPATDEYLFTAPVLDSPGDGDTVVADGSGGIFFSVTAPAGADFTMYFDGVREDATAPGTGASQEYYWQFDPGEHTLGTAFWDGDTVGAVREITITVTEAGL